MASLAGMALLAACADPAADDQLPKTTPQPDEPRAVDVAAIAPSGLVDAVLDECHRPLRGRMQRVAATIARGDERFSVFAELPDKVRVQAGAARLLLRDGAVHRLDGDAPSAADEALVRELALLVDAAAFGPLHRAATCARVDDATFDVTTRDGVRWRLALRAGTLLPRQLGRDARTVTIDDYLRTPTTWVARAAATAALGRCEVTFDEGGIRWADDFFATPREREEPRGQRVAMPGADVEAQTTAPVQQARKAARWVVLVDPGGWPERVRDYRAVYDELLRQEQRIAGFPLFWQEQGRSLLGVPFRRRADGPELSPPAGWDIRDVPAGQELVVHPEDGDLDARVAAGERALRAALERRGMAPKGPITAQPFLHLHKGEPTAEKLAAPTVRMAVAIE